ncbi:hypothetical protein FVER53590_29059 [Fusarium verticillioides]|nr:hypothetical protein FVER53263_20745 [Fusarium verticillioides]RBR22207.1 hypothetical protein FVER53590_29059 [Fusarium verticillioides]
MRSSLNSSAHLYRNHPVYTGSLLCCHQELYAKEYSHNPPTTLVPQLLPIPPSTLSDDIPSLLVAWNLVLRSPSTSTSLQSPPSIDIPDIF